MFIVNFFVGFYWLTVFVLGASAATGIGHGNIVGIPVLAICVALWFWRQILDWVQDRRWREWM